MLDDDIDARSKLGAKETLQRGADAARGTSAGHIAHVHAETAFDQTREMRQGGVQRDDIIGTGPLLRSEHRAGASGTGQRIGHIAGGDDGHVPNGRIHRCDVDDGYIGQGRSPTSQLVAVRVQETHAEGLQEAGAGVIGGAAAETDDDSSNAKTGGGEQQFAGTIG